MFGTVQQLPGERTDYCECSVGWTGFYCDVKCLVANCQDCNEASVEYCTLCLSPFFGEQC
jgi:hypothetical protein